MYAFDLVTPRTLEEALEHLADDEAQPLSGGQTLIPTLKARLSMPTTLVGLSRIPEMAGLLVENGALCIRAATTHATVAREATETYPALAALAGNIGDASVRNRGTIGGSLANNDPSACYPSAVLASGATIVTNTRQIAADDFFLGMFETALEPQEIIIEVRFPLPAAAYYEKFSHPASRFALSGVFLARFDQGVRVAVTGASEEGVFRWREAEAALTAEFSVAAVASLDPPSQSMISDLHGSGEYRAHLVHALTEQAVMAIIEQTANRVE